MPKHVDPASLQAAIQEINALALGVNLGGCFNQAAQEIASKLVSKCSPAAGYAIVCGLSGNSLLGMYLALELYRLRIGRLQLLLIGRASELNSELAHEAWQKLQATGVKVRQDCFAADIPNSDVIVECLGGLHLPAKPFKRSRDVVARISHFKTNTVSIDFPAPGYTPQLRFALDYPKHADDVVVSAGLAAQVEQFAGPGESAVLFKPRKDSYKQDNGKLLIIDQEQLSDPKQSTYVQVASDYAGTVFYYNPSLTSCKPEPIKLNSFSRLQELSAGTLAAAVEQVEAILLTQNVQSDIVNQALATKLLQDYPGKRYIIESQACVLLDPNKVASAGNMAFVLSAGSEVNYFMQTLGRQPHSKSSASGLLKRFVAEYNCFVRINGLTAQVYGRNLFSNQVEMRQLITGPSTDPRHSSQIAAQAAAYATKNDLWLALCSAA